MGSSPDVLILGGGVIGLTCAYFLAEVGLKVEVIDRQAMGREASWAGAGIIPPGNFERAGSPLDRLRASSVSQFPSFTKTLEETTGLPTGFRICGGIEFLDAESEYAVKLWDDEGIDYERVDSERLVELEPNFQTRRGEAGNWPLTGSQVGNTIQLTTFPIPSFPRKRESSVVGERLDSLFRGNDGDGLHSCGTPETEISNLPPIPTTPTSPPVGEVDGRAQRERREGGSASSNSHGYLLPGMGQVRNPWYLRVLIAGCEHLGVRLRPDTPAEGWTFDSRGRVDGVALNIGGTIRAGTYLLAAGSWAEPWMQSLGVSAGVQPVRGQMLLYRTERLLLHRIVIDGKRYFVPRADGRLLVGATEEPEAGFIKQTTPQGMASLRAFAESMVPALAHAELESSWAGLRPGSADGYPSIGQLPNHPNVFAAVGHFRAGIQLSLGTAHLIRDLVLNQSTFLDLARFAPGRVPNLPPRTAFRS